MERWITGKELMERWDFIPSELLAVMRSGAVVPVDQVAGHQRTTDNDPCLYCTVSGVGDYGIELGPVCPDGERVSDPDVLEWQSYSKPGKRICSSGWKPEQKIARLKAARFPMEQVEAYEQAQELEINAPSRIAERVLKAIEQAQGLKTDATAPDKPLDTDASPKAFADRMLAEGWEPAKVALALVERPDLPQWKAAALAQQKPITGLDQFEKDKLKAWFQRAKKKAKHN